jgi:hypothetical protein
VRAQQDKRDGKKYRSRIFSNTDEFIAARRKWGFSEESARILAPRALRASADATLFELTHDPRLNHASAIKLTEGMCRALYASVSAKALALVAEDGLFLRVGAEAVDQAVDAMIDCQVAHVRGGHHTHMEEGSEAMAEHISRFFS